MSATSSSATSSSATSSSTSTTTLSSSSTSSLSIKLDFDRWNGIRKELGSPDIDDDRRTGLINLFAIQLWLDLQQHQQMRQVNKDDYFLSGAAMCAPRLGSSTDLRGKHRPVVAIAERFFAFSMPHTWGLDATLDNKYKTWARIRYSQAIAALSVFVNVALNEEKTRTLDLQSATQMHASELKFSMLKNRPLSKEVKEPMAMPVTQTPAVEFTSIFDFLRSNNNPFHNDNIKDDNVDDNNVNDTSAANVNTNIANDSKRVSIQTHKDQIEFNRGVFYRDGRIDLCKQVLGPQSIAGLMDAMATNPHIKHFLLGNNLVGVLGAQHIAQYIARLHEQSKPSPILTWYLAGNNIDAEALTYLVDAWLNDTTVESIWLKRNPIGLSGSHQIARLFTTKPIKHHLTVLDLDNCGLLDEGVDIVCQALTRSDTLRHLYLNGNGISCVGAHSIMAMMIEFRDTGRKGLRSLYLAANCIGDHGLIYLAKALESNQHLKRLSLSSNGIEAEGVKALATALKQNHCLQMLELGLHGSTVDLGVVVNRMKNDGCFALADMLTVNTTLRYLSIVHNGLTRAGFTAMRAAICGGNSGDRVTGSGSSSLCHLDMVERFAAVEKSCRDNIAAVLAANIERLYGVDVKQFNRTVLPDLRNIRRSRFIMSVYRTRDFTSKNRKHLVKRWPDGVSPSVPMPKVGETALSSIAEREIAERQELFL